MKREVWIASHVAKQEDRSISNYIRILLTDHVNSKLKRKGT